MMDTVDWYVIWSHEHDGWWAGHRGYTQSLSNAARFTRTRALNICAEAIPGTARRLRALPELPVRLADIIDFVGVYRARYPDAPVEAFE